jgi:hypothetical protein
METHKPLGVESQRRATMSAERQIFLLMFLVGWVAIWWLAVRAVFGRWFGVLEWLPVGFAAFGVPMMIADLEAVAHSRISANWAIAGWSGVALLIGGVWVARRIRQWLNRC